jgi:hypothetical protein
MNIYLLLYYNIPELEPMLNKADSKLPLSYPQIH